MVLQRCQLLRQIYQWCFIIFLGVSLLFISSTSSCDVKVTIEDSGVMETTASIDLLGVETFDKVPWSTYWTGKYRTQFGLGKKSPIKGTYVGLKLVKDKGDASKGKYSSPSRPMDLVIHPSVHTATDSKYTNALPDYFGLRVIRMGAGHKLQFLHRGKIIYEWNGLESDVGPEGSSKEHHLPAFVNFFFNDCQYNEVHFDTPVLSRKQEKRFESDRFESDSHSVGYFNVRRGGDDPDEFDLDEIESFELDTSDDR